MVKVLFITSTLKRTGPTNVLFNLIAELDKTKFQPIILTLSPEDENFPSLWKEFEALSIEVFSFHLSRLKGFLFGTKRLKKFVNDYSIQVIHIFGFRGDLLINGFQFSNVKIITTINSNIYEDYTMLYGKFKGALMAYLHIRSLKNKIAVGCSQFVANQIQQRYQVRLKVIYNGISKELYKVNSTEEQINGRKLLGLPIDKKIVIFVGYLIYRKDPVTVIKGFLGSKYKDDMYLLIIGDGPLMVECKTLAENHNNIKFLGNQPETLRFLKVSDYYVSTAYSEGLPTSVMEAMGCGLPVILSDIEPHKELINNILPWEYMFNINDNRKLSLEFDQIIQDDYDLLSKKCMNVIDKHFNSNIMAKNYQRLYLN